jgi:hypothetical protein
MIPRYDIEIYHAIVAEPSPTIRKFKLMKTFADLLPPNAKELSANSIATLVYNTLKNDRPIR